MTPVSHGVHVAKLNGCLKTVLDSGNSLSDFPCNESRMSEGTLVVESQSGASEHSMDFLVILDDVVAGNLSNGVGRHRHEGETEVNLNVFILVEDFSEHFRGRGLEELCLLLKLVVDNSLADGKHSHGVDVHGVDGVVEGVSNMGLSSQVVKLVGLDLTDKVVEEVRVRHVSDVEDQVSPGEEVGGLNLFLDLFKECVSG